jgi:hypothetical protein
MQPAGSAYKVFFLGTEESSIEAEIEAYKEAHPLTHVVILYRKDCWERSTGRGRINYSLQGNLLHLLTLIFSYGGEGTNSY